MGIIFGKKKKAVEMKRVYTLNTNEYEKIPAVYQKQVGALHAELDVLQESRKRDSDFIKKQNTVIRDLQLEKIIQSPPTIGRRTSWRSLFVNLEKRPIKILTHDRQFVGFLYDIDTKPQGRNIIHRIHITRDHKGKGPKKIIMELSSWEDMFNKPFQLVDVLNAGAMILNIDSRGRYVPDTLVETNGEDVDIDEVRAEHEEQLSMAQGLASTAISREKDERFNRKIENIQASGDKELLKIKDSEITRLSDLYEKTQKHFGDLKVSNADTQSQLLEFKKKSSAQEEIINNVFKLLEAKQPKELSEIEREKIMEQTDRILEQIRHHQKASMPDKITIRAQEPKTPPIIGKV